MFYKDPELMLSFPSETCKSNRADKASAKRYSEPTSRNARARFPARGARGSTQSDRA